ncbi:hypothetical protein HO133_001429 [Letharia lupina]|uniref:Utp8 beta-propeller domain-containing protein n=1 Tax=Letharia lupina TaxID=560253 RepID=A0A8H6CEZ4_9LECA|nr:uncharacterized protein HO133_001429 [Letharia lupina]KAF6222343.1 hypothetical protein HO133_001429 [Letharia lupina]
MIQKPYLLADIQQDLNGLPNILATDVLAVAGSKKRKRSELALAIDRQGINIYDIHSSKLITSYAISPQAVFTCPPCSIRSRRLRDEPARRCTYCSVTSPKPRLICFSEFSNAEITTTSINLSKEAAPVSHLDTFQAGSGNKLLALHDDGTVTGYSNGLETEEWRSNINAGASNLVSVPAIQAAAILSVQQARKTILRSREDILATLGPDEDPVDRSLLLVMTRSPTKDASSSAETLELRMFHIRMADSDTSGVALGPGQELQPLATLAMPEPSLFTSKKSRITIHTASGTIYQDAEGALAVYDLTGSVPCLLHTVVRNDTFSYLRLSPELVASSRGASLSVMDLPYKSLQAEGTLTLNHEAKVKEKSKNPNGKPTITENVRLLSYFAPLDVIVALAGRKLLAVQLPTTQKVRASRKRKREGLLVNSIGRGFSSMTGATKTSGESARKIKNLGSYLPSVDSDDWRSKRADLDRCLAHNDEKEFERLMATALGMKAIEEDKQASNSGGRNHVDQHAVSYVLKTMFLVDQASLDVDPAGEKPRSLDIRFFPHKIGNWLIDKGLLTLSQIEKSLKQYGALPVISKLAAGSLIRAIAKLDSSVEILLSILASPVPLSSEELVHILVIVTQSPNPEATETQHFWTNGDGEDDSGKNGTSQLVNGQTTDYPPSSSPILPDNNLSRRSLYFAMKRLYACPSSSVAQALKRELSTPQLRILVDTLRMEIARSGWLSPYEDSLEAADLNLQDDRQMCFLAHLLNSVIDGLGTGGWILGSPMTDDLTETADTIAYMKAEISAALEGIEEATYLKGMLGEILLCGKDSLNSSVTQPRSNEAQPTALPTKPVTIALDEEDSQLLPLGLKPAPVVSTTKVGAGGELIKRSRRDIGRLKSKMVGKYSFDRVMI